MAFRVSNKKREEGKYRMSFGKGNNKLTAINGKDSDGKWGVVLEASGDVLCIGKDTQGECKEAFYDWAVTNYKGKMEPDQSPASTATAPSVAGLNPDGTPMHPYLDISNVTGMNEAERITAKNSFTMLYAFAKQYGPRYFQNDPQGLAILNAAADDVYRLTLEDRPGVPPA